ncbi:oligosaccharide flippase family protein [Lutibacter sp.]
MADNIIKGQDGVKSLRLKVKELSKHFLIYGIGSALQGLVTFLLLPVLSKFLTTEEYGRYALIVLIGTLFGSFFYLGGQTAITRFYYESKDKENQTKAVTNTALIMLIGSILCIISGVTASSFLSNSIFHNNIYSKVIIFSILSASLGIINVYLITFLRLRKKSFLFILVNVLNLSINFLITYFILKYSIFKNDLIAPFVGQAMGLFISILFSAYPVIKLFKIKLINTNLIKEYLRFGLPVVIHGFIYYSFVWTDRLLIERYLTLSDVGIYSFGYQLGTIVNLLFVTPFILIFSVLRMEYAKDKNTNLFFSKITTYYTIIGLLIVIVLITFSKQIITVAASSTGYFDAIIVIPWILLSQMILGYAAIFDFGIYYSKKTYFYIFIYLFVLGFNILMNLFFLKKYGYEFAAINKTISYVMLVLIIYFISNKYYVIRLEKRFFKVVFSGIITGIIIHTGTMFGLNIIFDIVLIILLILYWYNFILIKQEKNLLSLKEYLHSF